MSGHIFGLPHIACDSGLSVSSLGDVVCGNFFPVDVLGCGVPMVSSYVFVYCNELAFQLQEAKDFHSWPLSCSLS